MLLDEIDGDQIGAPSGRCRRSQVEPKLLNDQGYNRGCLPRIQVSTSGRGRGGGVSTRFGGGSSGSRPS